MDRKQWLTMLYREANLFLEHHDEDGRLTVPELDELEPELHAQLQEVLRTSDSLEDLIKHSLLRAPPPQLWQDADEWGAVLARVASACLLYDARGVIVKTLEGELPRTSSQTIHEPAE